MSRAQGSQAAYHRPFVTRTTEVVLPSAYVPSAGHASDILHRFNETDATQTDATMWAARAPDVNSVGPPALYDALTATSAYKTPGQDGGVGARLAFTMSAGSATVKTVLFRLLDTTTADSWLVPNRFEIRFRIAHLNNVSVGFFLHNNDSAAIWGFGFANLFNSNTTQIIRCEGTGGLSGFPYFTGNFQAPGTSKAGISVLNTTTNPSVGGYLSYMFDTVPTTGATTPLPIFTAWPLGALGSSGNSANTWPPNGSNSILGNPPIAGWTGKAGLNYLGVVLSNTGAPSTGTAEIAEFMVLKHPMDRF